MLFLKQYFIHISSLDVYCCDLCGYVKDFNIESFGKNKGFGILFCNIIIIYNYILINI